MGDGIKMPMPSELGNRDIARKSLVASRDIAAGEMIAEDMIAIKRPGTGMSPMGYWGILGSKAQHDLSQDEEIECD
jgi:sialic acid synthase SpsE